MGLTQAMDLPYARCTNELLNQSNLQMPHIRTIGWSTDAALRKLAGIFSKGPYQHDNQRS